MVPTNWKLDAAGDEYASPDLPIRLAVQAPTATADADLDAIMLSIYPDVSKVSELTSDAGTWSIYAVETGEGSSVSYNVYGVNVLDGRRYIVTATTSDEVLVPLMLEYIFTPARRAFAAAP